MERDKDNTLTRTTTTSYNMCRRQRTNIACKTHKPTFTYNKEMRTDLDGRPPSTTTTHTVGPKRPITITLIAIQAPMHTDRQVM